MFERFTDRARRAIVYAQDAARDMGHSQISPEHMLVGLQQGEGLAAKAMAQAGVDGTELRQRVATLYKSNASAKMIDKVPFSREAKKCLEQALRSALGLGHNYIGTEHIFFGVQREAEASNRALDELLGVSTADIDRRLTEMLGDASFGRALHSPALASALARARTEAGQSPITTAQVLGAVLADPDSQVSRAFNTLSIDSQAVLDALEAVNVDETSDASPSPKGSPSPLGKRPPLSPTRTLRPSSEI